VSVLEQFGVDYRVAVNLHAQPVREIVGRGGRNRLRDGAKAIGARMLDRLEERLGPLRRRPAGDGQAAREEGASGPTLFDVLTASMTILEYELARYRLAFEPADVLLTPHVEGIRAFEFHKARRAIQSGAIEAQARLPEILQLLTRRRRRARGGYTWGSSSPSPSS
jgi:NTE family protein